MNDLTKKAIDIKGKKYVLVKDRIIAFNEEYKNGMIRTHLLSEPDADMVVMKAQVIPDIEDKDRFFVGHSQAKWGEGAVNKTAAMENAETSAVGRALAMMGIGVIDSVASADEMKKVNIKSDFVKDIADDAECPIHKVPMRHFEKDGKEWWSHQLENGEWCNGRDNKANKEL